MKQWILYVILLCFAAYWASNLILWFPWSYSTALGITLMLTVSPVLWAFVTFEALRAYPAPGLWKAATFVSVIFLVMAVIMDYFFFGIIRNAMEALYQPTTFYGYGFLVFWPFFLALIAKNKIRRHKKTASNRQFVWALFVGLFCLTAIVLIVVTGLGQ